MKTLATQLRVYPGQLLYFDQKSDGYRHFQVTSVKFPPLQQKIGGNSREYFDVKAEILIYGYWLYFDGISKSPLQQSDSPSVIELNKLVQQAAKGQVEFVPISESYPFPGDEFISHLGVKEEVVSVWDTGLQIHVDFQHEFDPANEGAKSLANFIWHVIGVFLLITAAISFVAVPLISFLAHINRSSELDSFLGVAFGFSPIEAILATWLLSVGTNMGFSYVLNSMPLDDFRRFKLEKS